MRPTLRATIFYLIFCLDIWVVLFWIDFYTSFADVLSCVSLLFKIAIILPRLKSFLVFPTSSMYFKYHWYYKNSSLSLINTDDLNSASKGTNMNVRLQWGKWCLLNNMWSLWILLWLANCIIEFPLINIAHLQKCGVLFVSGVDALCAKLTVNHVWWYLIFSPLVRSTKWPELMIWS